MVMHVQRNYSRYKGNATPDPAKVKKYTIVGLLIAIGVTALILVVVLYKPFSPIPEQTESDKVNEKIGGRADLVLETSGTWDTWWDLGALSYQYVTMWVNSSSSGSAYTYKLIPASDLPFTPGNEIVVVYQTEYTGTTKYIYGVKGSKGWWLGFVAQPGYDIVTVNYLLDLSQGVIQPKPTYIVL